MVRPLDDGTLTATITESYLYYREHGYSASGALAVAGQRNREALRIISGGLLGLYRPDERVSRYGDRFLEWGEEAGEAALELFVKLYELQGLSARKARRRTVSRISQKYPAPIPGEGDGKGRLG